MVGALRGLALVENEDEDSEWEVESDDKEEGTPEICEPSALEQFLLLLQRAYDVTLEAECECKRGNKRPKVMLGILSEQTIATSKQHEPLLQNDFV